MKFLQRVAFAYATFKALPGQVGQVYDTTSQALVTFMGGGPTASGMQVNADSAKRQATALTCARVISETIGSLPLGVYEVDAQGNSTKVDHDLSAVLSESPNADQDPVEFEEAKTCNLVLNGNSFCYRNQRADGSVSSLYPIPNAQITPYRKRDTGEVWFKLNDRGRVEDLPREKVWHVKAFGSDGLMGLSVIGLQRELLGMALATQDFQARFFANGAVPTFLVSLPKWLTPDQRKIARENIQDIWSGPANAYKAQMLEGGMTATPVTMPLQDAQFLDLAKKTRSEIFGMFRVPPHMGGDLERSTNNNIEQQALEFIMYCILPYLRRNESSAAKWLFKPGESKRFRLRYNVEGLLRADAAGRGTLYNILLQNGVLNRNEVRSLEGRNRSDAPGMDDYTVQTNMTPIDMLRKIAEQAAKPKPAPVVTPGPGSAGKTSIMLPSTSIDLGITVMPPDVKVAPPAISFSPEIIVHAPQNADPEVRDMLGDLKDLTERLHEDVQGDRELLFDKEGNPVRSRLVRRE